MPMVKEKRKRTSPPASPVDEDFNLWILLGLTRDIIEKARLKEFAQYGLKARQGSVLYAVHMIGDRATPSEISRWLFREPHTISLLLDRMEKDGLIKKTKDPERRNIIRVSLTDTGQKAYQLSTRRKSIHRVFSSLSEEQREQLKSCLELLQGRALKVLGIRTKPELPIW